MPYTPLELTGIEVTQVVQDLDNSVPLIAYKPTYVRAYVRSLMPRVPIENVTAQLSAYQKIFFAKTSLQTHAAKV